MTITVPITSANPTVQEMEARVARFAALRPTADYVDAGIPGCERTTYRVIGVPPDAPLAVPPRRSLARTRARCRRACHGTGVGGAAA